MDNPLNRCGVRSTPVVLPSLLGLLAACGAGERAGAGPVVRDSAGITIVENAAAAWRPGEGWRLSESPVVEIGVAEGDEAYQLFRVSAATRLSDGRIAVLNAGTRELRYYDPQGRHLRSVGGEGEGPGEFRYPSQLIRLPGDTLLVWDGGAFTASWFGPQGELVRSASADPGRINALFMPSHFTEGGLLLPDGTLLLRAFERPARGTLPEGVHRSGLGVIRASMDAARADTLGWFRAVENFIADIGGRRMPGMRFFARRTQIAFGGEPLRIYVGDTGSFDIGAYTPDGRLERRIRRSTPPLEVTPQDVEHERTRRLEWAARQGRVEVFERYTAAMPMHETLPAFASLAVDVEGNLWVEEYRRPGDEQPRWTVFDPGGRLLGTLALPPRLRILEIGPDYLLGVAWDELEVERLRLYRLDRSAMT